IAPVAIIDQQLPFEYTIASRSTDVMVWNAVYDAHNEVACLMLGSITLELHGQLKNSSPYEMLQELKSMFKKQAGVERFVRNYNMHNKGKTIGELHALLIEYEKGLPKKAVTPQVMTIQGGRIQKANKKSLNAKGKEVGHCKRNCSAYLAELIKKKKQVGTASSSGLRVERKLKQVEAIRSDELVLPNGLVICLGNFHYAPTITRGVVSVSRLVDNGLSNVLRIMKFQFLRIIYPKETMGYYFYFPPENKIVIARYAEFLEKNLLSQEVSGWAEELKEIQDKDTPPSENTSEIPMEVEGFKPPQEEVVLVRRSARTHRAPNRLFLNVEVKVHSLRDLNEPNNYKPAILDLKSDKWVDTMSAEMQSMKDNQVWCLVDLPPNSKTVRSKWLFKKKNDMDGIVHTYKARLVAKGFIDPKHPRKVCKLQKSIYGLKQASRSWNKRFDEEIKRMDNSKCGYIPMQERLDLNKTQGASTLEEVKRMQNVPYASAVGKPHWTSVKTILNYLRNIKDMILVYDGNPEAELRVDYYCNAGFETNRDDIKSRT
ncbi:retrotransposon protein, putative, ty1-copia subclass, partial [Tanacetum coccineum]